MMCKGRKGGLLISLCALAPLLLGSAADAAQPGASPVPTAADAANLSDRMDRLEAKLREVQTEVEKLRREKQAVQQELDHQRQAAAPKAQLAQSAAPSHSYGQSARQVAGDRPFEPGTPSSKWGTRIGYQDFPYHQKDGGLFYSFFFDHRLLSQAEGVPLGDLDAEIAVGIGRSGTDHVNDFSDVLVQKQRLEYRQNMLSGWIGLKYYLDQWAPLGVRPYIIGGPGIWGDVVESPPLFIGETHASKALAARKLPVDAAANLYQGGQGGAGLDLNLARTGVPILERVNLGLDYRYSAWTSGERFSSYSFSLSLND
jgi:hypothetical protein